MPRPPAAQSDGLTATGATLLSALLTSAGALIDIVVFRGINWIFTFAFVVAALWVALRIDGRQLFAAIILPPWMFVLGIVLAQQVLGITGAGSWLVREVSDTFSVLTLLAPRLLGAEAAAALIVLSRTVRARRDRADQTARPAAARRSPHDGGPDARADNDAQAESPAPGSGLPEVLRSPDAFRAAQARHSDLEPARPEEQPEREFWRP